MQNFEVSKFVSALLIGLSSEILGGFNEEVVGSLEIICLDFGCFGFVAVFTVITIEKTTATTMAMNKMG